MGSQSNIKREGEEQATGEEPVMLPDVTVSAPKPKQSLCFNHELGGFGGGEIKEEEPRYGRWGGNGAWRIMWWRIIKSPSDKREEGPTRGGSLCSSDCISTNKEQV